MKIKCDAQSLKNSLMAVMKVAQKCPGVLVANKDKVLFKARSNYLELIGCNNEQSIDVTIPAEVDEELSFIVGIKELVTFLNKDKVVTITKGIGSKPNDLILKTENSTMKLSEFTKVEDFKLGIYEYLTGNILPESFIDNLKRVLPFKAKGISRPTLEGVSLITDNKLLSLATADGFRLAIADIPYESNIGDLIIPGFACELLSKLAGKSQITIMTTVTKNAVRFSFGNITLDTVLVVGTFPKYRGLRPVYDTTEWRFNINSILLSQRLGQILDSGANIVRIYEDKGTLKIISRAEEYFNYESDIAIQENKNTGKVALNRKYFIQALKPFTEVKCTVAGVASPVLFEGDIAGFSILAMPMFVEWA